MSRRFHRDVDGILLLDKPLGLSSNAALQQVRVLFGANKAGHAGSLDPLASGLLPVCFGQATKVCGRILNAAKTYLVTIQLGARTASLDSETPVCERAAVPALSAAGVDAVLASFLGEQQQIPPMHSALKHQGERLYELARRGEDVTRAARRIEIHRLLRCSLSEDSLSVEVRCSKGTYIRCLAADIARQLGTLGYVAMLRRLAVDPFDAYPMYTLPELEAQRAAGAVNVLDPLLLPADTAFMDLGRIELAASAEQSLLLGQTVAGLSHAPCEPLRGYGSGGRFLGLVQGQADGRVRALRLFVSVDSPRAEGAVGGS
jgi:tRNA pseudouridine55 synthase